MYNATAEYTCGTQQLNTHLSAEWKHAHSLLLNRIKDIREEMHCCVQQKKDGMKDYMLDSEQCSLWSQIS